MKLYFVEQAFITSIVSNPNFSYRRANSFMSAILTSLNRFSVNFTAFAVLGLLTRITLVPKTASYSDATIFVHLSSIPHTTLGRDFMFERMLPGSDLSGQLARPNSEPDFRPDSLSRTGKTRFSAVPGPIVLSIITMLPFFMCFPMVLHADITAE